MSSTLLLIDGKNVAYRAKHTFSLMGPDGFDVSATYGFIKLLSSYLKRFKPESCIVAWDGRIPRFRREQVPSYKANRIRDPDYLDFVRQLREIQGILPHCGIVSIREPAMEADDLIYQASYMSQEFYDKIIIVSNDTDLFQTVSMSNTFVFNATKNTLIDRKYVEKQSGVKIGHFVHWRALQGDKGDNIMGVPGIGPVRATKLFQKYGTLSDILDAADNGNMSGVMGANIKAFGLERISQNVFIMRLDTDRTGARLAISKKVKEFRPANVKKLKKFLVSKAFIDLMSGGLLQTVRKLKAPQVAQDIQTPVVCDQRFPVEA